MKDRRFPAALGLAALALVVLPCLYPTPARGQFGTRAEPQVVNVFLPAPREIRRQISEAELAVQEGRFSEAVEVLGTILADAEAEDYFLSASGQEGAQLSLKAQATRLLGQMPPKGRQLYEDRFGAEARRIYDGAVVSGDLHALADITRMYFHTEAGYAATMLLGRYRLDEGRPLAAALCFKRLVDSGAASRYEPQLSILLANCWRLAGQPEAARDVLLALKRRQPDAKLRIGDRDITLFENDDQALPWLEQTVKLGPLGEQGDTSQWALYRGDPARNARGRGAMPLRNKRWHVPTINDPPDEDIAKRLLKQYHERSVAVLPAFQPIAVQNLVLMRTPERMIAVDFVTGKRIWEYPWFESPYSGSRSQIGTRAGNNSPSPRDDELSQRLFEDAAYGQIASDGKSAFLLDKLRYATTSRYAGRVIMMPGGRARTQDSSQFNELVAVDLKTQGKLRWVVGGELGGEEPRLAGAFFLGPPLPLLGQLYVLAEFNGEIRLVVLDARTGHLDWAQQIALLEGQSVVFDRTRRLAGATPSFADGVLVCPTSAGAVVAVDVATRSLLWGYQYKQESIDRRFRRIVTTPQRALGSRWDDATVTIADGRVLLTPVESNELLCLDLLTGESLWENNLPRGEMLFVAGVHDGHVIVVGKDAVRGLRLADAEPAWETPLDAMPSGRGFISDDFYFQPTTASEVLKISLSDGEIAQRSETTGILGNLICYKDEVISQGYDDELAPTLAIFYQDGTLREKVAEALQRNPDDAWALARNGELLQEEGHPRQAVESFRKAFRIDDSEEHRQLLVDAILAALENDFDANRTLAEEAERLIQKPARRADLLRVTAVGRQNAGELSAALRDYLELASLDATESINEKPRRVLEQPAPDWKVQRARWVQAKLTQLLDSATAEQRREIDGAVAAGFEEALAAASPGPLRRISDLFPSHPRALTARLRLVERLLDSGARVEAELLLAELAQSGDRKQRAAAEAMYCRLLERAGQTRQAAQAYRRLAETQGDAVCLDGMTGRQLVAAVEPQSPVGQLLAASTSWNSGPAKVETSAYPAQQRALNQRTYPVTIDRWALDGDERMQVRVDQSRQEIVLHRADGEQLARIPAARVDGKRAFPNYSLVHGKAAGNLLVLSFGFEILAIDAVEARENPAAAILWRFDLAPLTGDGRTSIPHLNTTSKSNPWGDPIYLPTDPLQRPFGQIASVGKGGVCFQYGERLLCLDPLTGDEVWARYGLPEGCDVFGDEELLFAIPPGAATAQVYSTIDGRRLEDRKLSSEDTRWETFGRNLLAWQEHPETIKLKLVDLATGKLLLQKDYPRGTKATIVDSEELAVYQPDGSFSMFRLDDGKETFSLPLAADPRLASIYVLRQTDRYLLMTNRPITTPLPDTNVQAAPGGFYAPLVSGSLYAFERATGKPQWAEPVEIEQYGFPVDQPRTTPVVVFLRHLNSTAPGTPRTTRTSVLGVDLRSGRKILDEEFPATTSGYSLVADLSAQSVELGLPGHRYTIQFAAK